MNKTYEECGLYDRTKANTAVYYYKADENGLKEMSVPAYVENNEFYTPYRILSDQEFGILNPDLSIWTKDRNAANAKEMIMKTIEETIKEINKETSKLQTIASNI